MITHQTPDRNLLYIGKSNKRFTHNKIYNYWSLSESKDRFHISVFYNDKQLMTFRYFDYFNKKFKFITENEYNQLIIKSNRKLKLKKICRFKNNL
jgi:hypothetical protein